MDKRYRHLLRATLAALPLACAAVLSSCAFDDDVAECPDPNAPATVRVSVSAGEPGDLNGTRAGDDVNADEQEFMHTLRLYIVNDNDNGVRRTVLNLSPDLTNNTLAQTGDLTNYETGEFTLAPGTYTIYAFANVDGYDGEFGTDNGQRAVTQMTMTKFLDDCFAIDQQVRDGDLAEYRIYNPAENLVANGKYIPMSAKKTITITPNTRDISIGLDRLVSKVRITVPDNQYVSTNSTITFSGYSENVPLLGADNGGYGDAQLYGGTTTTDEIPFTQVGEDVSFYVNETPDGDPFTVTLNTGKSGNGDVSAYVAKTQRTDIPRNSIYPLSLTFPDFTPQFEWQSWEAAIGAVPVEVVVEVNNYIVKIASGNTFKFTVNGVYGTNSQLQSATATWAHGDVTNQITDIQIGNNAISGAISAGVPAETQIPLTVKVNWTANYTDATGSTEKRNFTRTYNVTIETIDIWDTKYKSSTRSGSWRAYRLTPEVLNMFIKR